MTTTAPLGDAFIATADESVGAVLPGVSTNGTATSRRAGFRLRAVGPVLALDVVSVAVAVLLVSRSAGLPVGSRAQANLGVWGLLWISLLLCCSAYHQERGRSTRGACVLRASVVLGLLCWSVPTVVEVTVPPEQLVVLTAVLATLGLVARTVADAPWGRVTRNGATRVLVAGEAEDVARAVAELSRTPREHWEVIGSYVVGGAPQVDDTDVVGRPATSELDDDIARMIDSAGADAVVALPCRDLGPARLRRLGWLLEARGTRVYVGTGLLDVAPSRAALVSAGDLSLVELRAPSGRAARWVKAAMDRTGAAILLVLLAPLLGGVALAVRLDTAGPAIFRQVRVGRDGREFTMYKFRTMTVGSDVVVTELVERNESDGGVLFKIRADPRITRVGGLLRRYSVDELPQLVNVLLGQMALVGPRPALPGEVARYDVDPRRRLAVRPGLTGLWQVSGRSDLSWEETVRLDLHYVDNWSLGADLRILRRTLRAILAHDGAY